MADLSTSPLPTPAPLAAERASAAAQSVRSTAVPRGSDGASGHSFADELNRQAPTAASPARDDATRAPAKADGADTTDPGKKGLAPLRKVAKSVRQMIDGTPAVALLTGHLERLTAGDLPELITSGKFVSKALDSGDLGQFMAKPEPVAELVRSLDLPPQILQAAQQMGLDPTEPVTPGELLKALGLDPQRVYSQLKAIEEKVALASAGVDLLHTPAPAVKDDDRVAVYAEKPSDGATPGAVDANANGNVAAMAPIVPGAGIVAAASNAGRMPAASPAGPPVIGPMGLAGADVPMPQIQAPVMPPAPNPGNMLRPGHSQAEVASPGDLAKDVPPGLLTLAQPFAGFNLALAKPVSDLAATPVRDTTNAVLPAIERSDAAVPAVELNRLLAAASLQGLTVAADAADVTAEDVTADVSMNGSAAKAGDAVKDLGRQLGNAAPTAHRATFDAFATLGDRLRAGDMQKSSFVEPTVAPRADQAGNALAEQLARVSVVGPARGLSDAKPLAAISPAMAAPALASPMAVAASLSRTSMLPQSAGAQALTPDQLAAAGQPESQGGGQPAGLAVNGAKPSAVGLTASLAGQEPTILRGSGRSLPVPADDLRLAAPVIAMRPAAAERGDGEQAGDDGERRDDGRRDGNALVQGKALRDLGTGQHAGVKHDGHVFGAHIGVAETGLTPQQRVDLMQKVIDRASLLAREGGGSVRLDLHAAGLGPVELAVNLDKDRVDVRVMTGSERVREAMLADLVKLKDALSVQSVRLGNVEVGVDRRQPQPSFAGFAGNGQGGRQQAGTGGQNSWGGQPGERRAPSRELTDALSALRRPMMPKVSPLAMGVGASGRIAVRV